MKKFPCTKHKTKESELRRQNLYNLTEKTHEGKPREDKVEGLIKEFDVYPEFARKRVRRAVYIMELDCTVYRSKERAIEPSATLRD
jgi:hypothetical protein